MNRLFRSVRSMELEDRIFHSGLLIAASSVFFPWLTGGITRETSLWENGFSFRTGLIGHAALLLVIFLFLVTFSPALGGPVIVRRSARGLVRLSCASALTLLLAAAFTVVARTTFEIPGTDIRYGLYLATMASALSTFYAALSVREQLLQGARQPFRHPDEPAPSPRLPLHEAEPTHVPPPPPPPPPLPPEDHPSFAPLR